MKINSPKVSQAGYRCPSVREPRSRKAAGVFLFTREASQSPRLYENLAAAEMTMRSSPRRSLWLDGAGNRCGSRKTFLGEEV